MKKFLVLTLILTIVLIMVSAVFAYSPTDIQGIATEIGVKSDELRLAIAGVLAKVSSAIFFICILAGLFGGGQKFKSFLKYGLMISAVVGIVSWGWVAIENFLLK